MIILDLFNADWSINWPKVNTIPCFKRLSETPQSTTWHKEGNAFIHTQLVVDSLSKILEENNIAKGSIDYFIMITAALCHDLGKPDTTKWSAEKNDYTAKNHSAVGERITRELLFDENIVLREIICYMVRHHMILHHIFDNPQKTNDKLIRLSNGIVPIENMLWLNAADSFGSITQHETQGDKENKIKSIKNLCKELDCLHKPYDKEQEETKTNFCIYVLCGFPGSGKSTLIENHLNGVNILSRDIIRGELGIGGATITNGKKVVGTKNEEEMVTTIFNKKMLEYCEKSISFAVDNTNLRRLWRDKLIEKVKKYKPIIKMIYVEAPSFENCVERRDGQIPTNVFNKMMNEFDFPQKSECDELIVVKQLLVDGKIKEHIIRFDSTINNIEKI